MVKRESQLLTQKNAFCLFLGIGLVVATQITSRAKPPQTDQKVQTIELSAKKYEFSPKEIRVANGTKVELKVHSVDDTHGLKIDVYPEGSKDKITPGLIFDKPAENGKVTKGVDQILEFVAKTPGTYDFKCAKVCGFGHDRMKGKLIVE